jgi:phosphoglycolate phosphatase-like HAD superfamily hydrolase
MKHNFEAVVTDIDRTLLDTEQFILQAFLYTLDIYHLPPITPKELDPLMGRSLEACYEALAPCINNSELAETHRIFQEKTLIQMS